MQDSEKLSLYVHNMMYIIDVAGGEKLKVMQPSYLKMKNYEGLTPLELFTNVMERI